MAVAPFHSVSSDRGTDVRRGGWWKREAVEIDVGLMNSCGRIVRDEEAHATNAVSVSDARAHCLRPAINVAALRRPPYRPALRPTREKSSQLVGGRWKRETGRIDVRLTDLYRTK